MLKTTKIVEPEVLSAEDAEFNGLDPKRSWRLVLSFVHEDFGGIIAEDDDGAALSWTDYVANTWVEAYSSMPLALMRLALLMHAGEPEEMRWFKTADPLVFSQAAVLFMEGQLTSD